MRVERAVEEDDGNLLPPLLVQRLIVEDRDALDHDTVGDRVGKIRHDRVDDLLRDIAQRSEEHTSELQSLMRISYAVFCLKNKKNQNQITQNIQHTTSTHTQYHTY